MNLLRQQQHPDPQKKKNALTEHIPQLNVHFIRKHSLINEIDQNKKKKERELIGEGGSCYQVLN